MREYDFSGLSVLVVDDNRHFIAILRTYLREFGIRKIYEATDAFTALDTLTKFEIDLALVDFKLGELDGLELTRMIREASDSQNPRMPIIVVTAHTERSVVQEALNSGINEFLRKPVSARVLYERIIHIIDNPRPFLRAGSYIGPDRRRQVKSTYSGPERRKTAPSLLDPKGQETQI